MSQNKLEVDAEVKKCPAGSDFCLVGFGNIEGWISKNNLYGIYPVNNSKKTPFNTGFFITQ